MSYGTRSQETHVQYLYPDTSHMYKVIPRPLRKYVVDSPRQPWGCSYHLLGFPKPYAQGEFINISS